jgi:glucuronate isomerase
MRHPDRYFDSDPAVRDVARELYRSVAELRLVCPHGHVDPRMFAENSPYPDPATLIVIPDHYIFRMLYSRGIPLEKLGVPRTDGGPVEQDPRKIWQLFAENFHLYRGTPTGCWIPDELALVFGIEEPLNAATGMRIYDQLCDMLATPEFLPRALFERFRIEVLCTTDAATDTLEHHGKIRESGWKGRVIPTFRPDTVIDILHPNWKSEIEKLGALAGCEIVGIETYIAALENRRAFFKSMGAVSTDHACVAPYTEILSANEAGNILERALAGHADLNDARRFTAHMLVEMARMSSEDGLVMQLHPGCWRSHNLAVREKFGADKGCDIPVATEYTSNLHALLNAYGNHPKLRLVLFTLDESAYARELAPLAGHYPAVRLGPPWWFHDSLQGMIRYREQVTETAGVYNTAGFNDDTRAFPSIPARHDLSRRMDANFLARLVARHQIEMSEAMEMMPDLAANLARETYRLG